MTDQIPPSLVRFGEQYARAVRRELLLAQGQHHTLAGPARKRSSSQTERRLPTRSVLALPVVAAAATAVVLLVTSAGSLPTPAYALTRHTDGSVTVTIRNLARGVPQLNARLAQLGIRATAIPVTERCHADADGIGLIDFGHSAVAQSARSDSVTIDNTNVPAGSTGYVAAEQTATGQIALAIGTTRGPLPSCLSTNHLTNTTTRSQSGTAQSRANAAAHAAGLTAGS
jgi:hypothetical protein